MDKQFLEFWGNTLLAAAGGNRPMADLTRWIRQGFSGFEEVSDLFRKIYGLERFSEDSPDYRDAWQKATADFQKAFRDYFAQAGWVPTGDYRRLEEENARLKKSLEDREDTIRRLRAVLAHGAPDQNATLKVFQDLVRKQSEDFEKLMKNLADSTGAETSSSD